LKLNSEFDVRGFVKPGAKASDILGTNIEKDMSKDDFVVVCVGSRSRSS
jgi:hypothetical protein